MWRPLWIPWRWWRRAAQLALLLLFVWLFRRTESTGQDQLAGGENLFFRLDPLAGAAAMLAARQIIGLFWPAVVIVALTMVFGRFFCGWVCPLGTLLDYFHRLLRLVAFLNPLSLWKRVGRSLSKTVEGDSSRRIPGVQPHNRRLESPPTRLLAKNAKYVLLIAVMLAAAFSFPLVGYVDPFSLLVRGMALWADPLLFRGVDACFGWASEGWAITILQPFVKKHLLPFRPMVFHLAGVSAALLAVIFALELVARRFWCRYVCPAGALFGLLAGRSLVKRVPVRVCKACGQCAAGCRMDALDPGTGFSPHACTLCMDCVDLCPKRIVRFNLGARAKKKPQPQVDPSLAASQPPVDLSRRTVLAGIAAGVALPGVALAARLGYRSPPAPNLLRPPGGDDERTFLSLCIRCGECLKVCPTNVLQPAIFEAGLEGMFSPRLVPRLIFEQSYCEYACTLCGQVCPTGAIPRLTEEIKHTRPTGKAYFDHNLCLPWAEKTPCIRCEEMCPAPDKAIKIVNTLKIKGKDGQEVEIQQPQVDRDLCVGCGICESNCTIEGTAAIRVRRVDAPDPGTEFLLKPGPRPS